MRYQLGGSKVSLDTWDDLVRAATEGLLDETHFCDLKKGLPPPSENLEVARDIASLTVLGGLLIIGIEDAGRGVAGDVPGTIDPQAVATRLSHIADGLVQPSMVCAARVVENPADPERGCVLLSIPPSATAPHRAGER